MKQKIYSMSKAGLAGALAMSLTACVTRTVYVTNTNPPQQPPPEVVEAPPPTPPPAPPPVVVAEPAVFVIRNEVDFYEPLSPYGQWVVVASYGRCWRPGRVDAGWRPYSNGHWERTDAGWFWDSDEPWAWATYHYGRWDWTPAYGWIWVPQTQWAPAWVTWREGGGYIGWAPLPPNARIRANGSVEIHETLIAPRFVFVEHRRLMEPVHPKTVIVNNTTVVNKTVNITKITINNNNTVINEGPRTEVIERETGRKVRARPVHELRHKEEAPVVARRQQPPGDKKTETHRDSEPANRPPQKQVETPWTSRPAVNDKTRETREQKPVVARPARPEPQKPSGNERNSTVLPVAARPAAQPPAQPAVQPAVQPTAQPEPAPAVAPAEQAGKPARVAKEPQKPAPAANKDRDNQVRGNQGRGNQNRGNQDREVEKNPRGNAASHTVAEPAAKPAEKPSQMKSSKENPASRKSAPAEPAAKQKEEKKKKGEELAQPQVPVTPLPGQ